MATKETFKEIFLNNLNNIIAGILGGLLVYYGIKINNGLLAAIFIFLFALVFAFILTLGIWLDKKKNNVKKVFFDKIKIFYFYLLLLVISLFFLIVFYLNELIHPLTLSLSFIVSAFLISLPHLFLRKKIESCFCLFSLFFFISTLVLLITTIFLLRYNLSPGTNLEPQNVTFDVYVVNDALQEKELFTALNYSSSIWSKYNILIHIDSINYKNVNLSKEEVLFLFEKGNNQTECFNYNEILDKIIENKTKLNLIFLKNYGSSKAGRGCLCNCNFALISPEKNKFLDFTGWNTAHEIGHLFGLIDSKGFERTRSNLMNDESKKLFFFNSDFLDQSQVDIVVDTIKNKKLNEK